MQPVATTVYLFSLSVLGPSEWLEWKNSPSNADGCGRLGCSTVSRTRESMQVASHVDICHYDGPAAQHDVWFAFDFGLARDFVSGILNAMFSEMLRESGPWSNQCMELNRNTFMDRTIPVHDLRYPRWKRYRAHLPSQCIPTCSTCAPLAPVWSTCLSSSLLVVAARVCHALHVNPLLSHASSSPKILLPTFVVLLLSQHEVSLLWH